jgi:hypothetical protein
MNSRKALLLSAALCIAALLALPCRAADLTFYVGGVRPGSITVQNVRASLDSSPIFGFRVSTNFVPHFGMEHTLAFSTDYLFPRNIVTDIQDARGFVYNSNLIFSIPVKHAVPYITAGVGLIHQYGSDQVPVGTKFAVNYGGGVKFPRLAGPFGLRFDMRGYTATGIFSNKLNMLEVSGGIILSLGK